MAALNFPASPSVDDLYTANGSTWKWDGTSWNVVPANVLLSTLGDVTITSATTGDLLQYDGTSWNNEAGLFTNIIDNGTESTKIAVGTTAQRPVSPAQGDLRYNTDLKYIEVYSSDVGWRNVKELPFQYVAATGGTETTITVGDKDYKVHTFTSSGTFTVTQAGQVEFLVIGGGGVGGSANDNNQNGGGGGAGGYRSSVVGELSGGGVVAESLFDVGVSAYTVTIGAGASGGYGGAAGSPSSFGGITSAGGGGGSASRGDFPATSGGSGGGGGSTGGTTGASGTSGQGFDGGSGSSSNAGGGGGAGEAGSTDALRYGGDGVASSITGSSVVRAGGGAAGGGIGGDGGGGNGGADGGNNVGQAGTVNTGGGGGGGWRETSGDPLGGNGGSGIVIIRYEI
jgi:hypothetical protein